MAEVEPVVCDLYVLGNNFPKFQEGIIFTTNGIKGDKHFGQDRVANERDPSDIRGSCIKNDRMWSAVSIEEIERLCQRLELKYINPIHLRPNIVFEGIPNLSNLPIGTKLVGSEVILKIEAQNMPCSNPAKSILTEHPNLDYDEFKELFKREALGLRGVVGSVLKPGLLLLEEPIKIELPKRV